MKICFTVEIDGKLLYFYEKLLLEMLEYDPGIRISATQVVQELKSIKDEVPSVLCQSNNHLD